jgi:hypothetical protein
MLTGNNVFDALWDEAWNTVAILALLAIGVGLLLIGFALVALVFWLIAGVVASARYKRWLEQAGQEYDQVETELGVNNAADDVIAATWGAGMELRDEGWNSPLDFLDETVFGLRVDP